eukprot:Skav213626  [mRNA]  locus=scaffold2986:614122:619231:- [translate_table: standard]
MFQLRCHAACQTQEVIFTIYRSIVGLVAHVHQYALGRAKALVSTLVEPRHGLFIVSLLGQQGGAAELGQGIALLRSFQVPLQRILRVARNARLTILQHQGQGILRMSIATFSCYPVPLLCFSKVRISLAT